MEDAIREINYLIDRNQKSYVVAVNVDVIIKIESDPYLKEIADRADLVLVDGQPLIWISKINHKPIKEKISGSDLVPLLCKNAAELGRSIFIIGGKEGIAQKAKLRLEETYSDIKIVGTYAPPFGFEKNDVELVKINSMIKKACPDILIACFGCPKQEKWIYENYQEYNAKVSVCAGATVDFLAENIKRCPKWMSEYGLEWFYRFIQEPRRLFKRYFIEDLKILKLIFKYW